MKRAAIAVVLAGCYHTSPPPPLRNQAASVTSWRLGDHGVGPLDATSEATEKALQRVLPGVRVATESLGVESGIVFDVFDGAEKLFYVVPDDAPEGSNGGYAKTIFSVFATSPRITVDGHAWRVGSKLDSAAGVGVCECWGEGEVTACWTTSPHVRVIFETACDPDRPPDGFAMVGKTIGRIMWKREADSPPAPATADPPPPPP